MFERKKLLIEDFSDYIKIKFPYFYIVLMFTLYLIQIYFLYGIYINNRTLVSTNYWFMGLLWIMPFFLVNVFSLFFIKRINTELFKNINKLSDFVKNDDIINNEINKIFSNNIQIIIFIIPFISFMFQIYFCIINPAPWWFFQHFSSNFVFYFSLFTAINTGVSYWIICNYVYMCISATLILYKIIKNLHGINAEKVEFVPWNAIGNTSYLISTSWIVTLSPMLIILISSGPLWWWAILQVVGYSLVSLFLFIYPLYTSYTAINEIKHELLLYYKKQIWERNDQIKADNISSNEFNDLSTQIRHYELIETRIKKISPWPIEIIHIIQYLLALTASLITLILQLPMLL